MLSAPLLLLALVFALLPPATVALAVLIPLLYASAASSNAAVGWALLVFFGALMLVAARLAWSGGRGEPWALAASSSAAFASSSASSATESDSSSDSTKAVATATAAVPAVPGPLFVARARARFDFAGVATLLVACVHCAQWMSLATFGRPYAAAFWALNRVAWAMLEFDADTFGAGA